MSTNALKINKTYVFEVKTDKFAFQWKIKQFKYLFKQPREHLDSPIFSLGSKKNCAIRLFPNGDSEENKGFLSLYVCWIGTDVLKGEVHVSLINDKQEKQAEINAYLETKKEVEKAAKLANWKACGFSRFINCGKVFDKANGLLPNDCLTINCQFVFFSECVEVNEEQEEQLPMENPNLLKKIFLEDRFKDIKLIASCGKSLPAHRSVLAACSPVFEAMFTHDMLEQKMGKVKISDGKYEVIKEMLNFIYTGEVEDLKSIVYELVKLAHKYQIAGLIRLCETALNNQITADNVLKVITIADSYNIEHLKERAINFGSLHLKNVVNSDDFKSKMYPQAVQTILEAIGRQ